MVSFVPIEHIGDFRKAPDHVKASIVYDLIADGEFNFAISVVDRVVIWLARVFKGEQFVKDSVRTVIDFETSKSIYNSLISSIEDSSIPEQLLMSLLIKMVEYGWEPDYE